MTRLCLTLTLSDNLGWMLMPRLLNDTVPVLFHMYIFVLLDIEMTKVLLNLARACPKPGFLKLSVSALKLPVIWAHYVSLITRYPGPDHFQITVSRA